LLAFEGTEIFAVANGRVTAGIYDFYKGTSAIEIDHYAFIVRYGEIKGVANGIKRGSMVREGQVIAYVGKIGQNASMLHFEMYDKKASGALTVRTNPPYERRSDLIDPTPYLDTWAAALRAR
jgi:murein DD-endopeptidase MepM/ murein hydrolase activator NlpD